VRIPGSVSSMMLGIGRVVMLNVGEGLEEVPCCGGGIRKFGLLEVKRCFFGGPLDVNFVSQGRFTVKFVCV
jgi:hypothetical protein